MKVSKIALALACLGGMAAAHAQQAMQAEGDWMMRVRAVKLDTANKSDAVPVAGLGSGDIHVTDKTIPEVDFSYFFTKNIAAELILTVPQKHDVKLFGNTKVGSFKHLPPTLTLQYHFLPEGTFRPYVGAGVNYTRLSSVNLNTLDGITQGLGAPGRNHLDKNSWGGALQLGMDIKVANNVFLNFDVKKVYIKTELKNDTLGNLSTIKVDPLLIGVGLGFKF